MFSPPTPLLTYILDPSDSCMSNLNFQLNIVIMSQKWVFWADKSFSHDFHMITTNIDRQLPSIYHKTVVLQSYFSEPLGSSLVSFVDTISYLKNVDQIPGFPSCLCWGRLQNWVIYESTKSYPGFWGQYGWHWEKAVTMVA